MIVHTFLHPSRVLIRIERYMTRYMDIHPPSDFLQSVLEKIEQTKLQEKYVKFFWGSVFGFSFAFVGLIIFARSFVDGAEHSGFLFYVRYFFSDFLILKASIGTLLYAMIESFPIIEFAFLLVTLCFAMGTLRFGARCFEKMQARSFRDALIFYPRG